MRGVTFFLLLTLGACHRPPPPSTSHLPELPPPPADQIVAEVNGKPISADDVARQAGAAKSTVEEALKVLVRAELLAQVAEERGLAADKDVQLRARQEMARRYLRDAFEIEATPDNVITAQMLKRAYQSGGRRMNHPELRELDHVLVMTEKPSPAMAEVAEQIRKDALKTKTREEFSQLSYTYAKQIVDAGFGIKAEPVVTARTGWTVEPFAKAAFELTQEGQISSVVQSEFGYHIIRMHRTIPAENISLEQATPRIKEAIFPQARKVAFERFLERTVTAHHTTLYPERLKALFEQAGAP